LTPEEVRLALKHYYGLLDAADRDYNVAAGRTSQHVYMAGTFFGLVVLVGGISVVIAAGIRLISDYSVTEEAIATAFACAIAGALGATASVSWRVTAGTFRLADPGAGVLTLRRLGFVRPPIGAVFGLALYFGLKSGFINIGDDNENFYFFAFLAFVAGFSERAVPELIRTAEQRLGGGEPPASPPTVRARSG
jgi:hypothetical protein